MTNQSFLLMAN